MFLWNTLAQGQVRLHHIDAGGLGTRVIEAGDPKAEEAVVFLHGTGGHLEAFHRNLLPHAEHHRTIAFDMIGHGFSDKPDHDYEIHHYVKHVLDVADTLGIRKLHLHGESLGGWIAAQFAIDYPDRLSSLTLNTAGGLNTDPKVMERVYNVTMKAVAEASPETVRARLEWLMNDPARVTDDLVALRLAIYTQPDFETAMKHILCLQDMDIRLRNVLTDESLTAITAPTLVIWTDHDPTAPLATGQRFVDAIPTCRMEVMTDCAHWPQWEHADQFNRLHLDFLADHSAPRLIGDWTMSVRLICASHTPLMDHVDADPDVDRQVRGHFADLAREVTEYDPELIIIFGPDHFKGFFYDMLPSFTVGIRAEAIGDYDIGGGAFRVPERTALDCIQSVREADVDVAVSYRMQADHGFAQLLMLLTGAVDRFPVLPVHINCAGPPLPSFRRVRALGGAVGALGGRPLGARAAAGIRWPVARSAHPQYRHGTRTYRGNADCRTQPTN